MSEIKLEEANIPIITEENKPQSEIVPKEEEAKTIPVQIIKEEEAKVNETTPVQSKEEDTSKSTGNKLKVYGMWGSTCTRAVIMTLEKLGLKKHKDYEFVFVNLKAGEHKGSSHLTKQPFGQIPAIQDEDFILYESRAIARYLVSTRDQTNDLYPSNDPKARALIDQWLSINQAHYSTVDGIVFNTLFAPIFGAKTDIARATKLFEKASETKEGQEGVWVIMEKQLGKTKYLAGDKLTLADIFFFPYTLCMSYIKTDASHPPFSSFMVQNKEYKGFPNIKAWWDRIQSEEAFKEATVENEFVDLLAKNPLCVLHQNE